MKRFTTLNNLGIYICNIDDTEVEGDEVNIVQAQRVAKIYCNMLHAYGKDLDMSILKYEIWDDKKLSLSITASKRLSGMLMREFRWKAFTFNQWRISKLIKNYSMS